MVTFDGITLPNIRSEENGKTANLFTQPIPTSDSDQTFVLDLFGVTRTIQLTGSAKDTVANIQSFINTIEALINGSQTGKNFVSSIHSVNKTCQINSFRYTYVEGTVELLNYTMELIESSA